MRDSSIQLFTATRSVVLIGSLGVMSASALVVAIPARAELNDARPELHLPEQRVRRRPSLKPFAVEDYQGKLSQRYRDIRFVAPGGTIRWEAWIDPEQIEIVRDAMRLVEQRAVRSKVCNKFFARMPGGKTFAQLWQAGGQNRIRISYSPGPSGVWRAATYGTSAPYDWTITETAVRLGPESVASAMVHEATRTNGIGKEYAIAHAAERICGVQTFILSEVLIRHLGWTIVGETR